MKVESREEVSTIRDESRIDWTSRNVNNKPGQATYQGKIENCRQKEDWKYKWPKFWWMYYLPEKK